MSAISWDGFARSFTMPDKPTGLLGLLSTTAAMWTVTIGVVGLIVSAVSGYYNLSNRVDNLQSTVSQMIAQSNAVNADTRIHTLEDEQRYDSNNVAADMQGVSQREAEQEQEIHDQSTSLATISNQLSTIQAQMALIINHNITTQEGTK